MLIAIQPILLETPLRFFLRLDMVFEHPNIAIQIFHLDLWSAITDASAREAVATKNKFAIAALTYCCLLGQVAHGEIAIDAAVKGLETEIGGEIAREIKLDGSVHRRELGVGS